MSDEDLKLHMQLRAWARGTGATEAATELLIRSGFARTGDPWIRRDPCPDGNPYDVWIDFASIPEHAGGLSSGEYRTVLFAASLSDRPGTPQVAISELVAVERDRLTMMAAAVLHLAGQRDAWANLHADVNQR